MFIVYGGFYLWVQIRINNNLLLKICYKNIVDIVVELLILF